MLAYLNQIQQYPLAWAQDIIGACHANKDLRVQKAMMFAKSRIILQEIGSEVILRCEDLIIGSEGVEGVYSTLPKPLDRILDGYEKIEF